MVIPNLIQLIKKAFFFKHEFIIKNYLHLLLQSIHLVAKSHPDYVYRDILTIQSFLNAIFEIQLSHRINALNHYIKHQATLPLSYQTTNNIFIPILNSIIFIKSIEYSHSNSITDKTLSNFKTLLELSLDSLCITIKSYTY